MASKKSPLPRRSVYARLANARRAEVMAHRTSRRRRTRGDRDRAAINEGAHD